MWILKKKTETKKCEEKEAKKKSKVDNIKDELDQETQVRKMVAGASGLRPPVVDAERYDVMPPTTVVDSVQTEKSRT